MEALRHLPAFTKNRCCDLTGQQVRGPASWQTSVWSEHEKLSAAQVPGRDSGPLWYLLYSLLFFETFVHLYTAEISAGRGGNTSDLKKKVT